MWKRWKIYTFFFEGFPSGFRVRKRRMCRLQKQLLETSVPHYLLCDYLKIDLVNNECQLLNTGFMAISGLEYWLCFVISGKWDVSSNPDFQPVTAGNLSRLEFRVICYNGYWRKIMEEMWQTHSYWTSYNKISYCFILPQHVNTVCSVSSKLLYHHQHQCCGIMWCCTNRPAQVPVSWYLLTWTHT